MICNSCKGQNPENVNFCVNCGAPLRFTCPNCGSVNAAKARFCVNCGNQLAPMPPPPVPVPGQFVSAPVPAMPYVVLPVQPRRSNWLAWAVPGIFILLCGFLYWSMLIPVPLLPNSSPAAPVSQRARIIQENLPRPDAWQENAIKANGRDQPQDVGIDDGVIALPAACGPEIDLKVVNVSQTHIFDQLGQFGAGPLIYNVDNIGESMANAKYGYHVEWIVYDQGHRKVIKDNKWYACTGWDQDQLTCTGPDWRKYGSAQMCIFSDSPDCTLPLACFGFGGDNPFPGDDFAICDAAPALGAPKFTPGINQGGAWDFPANGVELPSGKYYLEVTLDNGMSTLGYCQFLEDHLRCGGFDPNISAPARWEILQLPLNVCTQPVAAGTIGVPPVVNEPPEICNENGGQICGNGSSIEAGTGDGTYKVNCVGLNPLIEVLKQQIKTCAFVGGSINMCAATALQNAGLQIQADFEMNQKKYPGYACALTGPNVDLICKGPPLDADARVDIVMKQGNCSQVLFTSELAAQAMPQLPSRNNRCNLFEGMEMKIMYLDWQPGAPLTFYIKMPGGVPGLEKTISGDDDSWNYTAEIGDYETSSCNYQDYKERLYCSISLPSEYSYSIRPMTLSINGCNVPIYSDQTADLPGVVSKPSSSGSSGSSSACGDAPSDTSSGDYISWCSCNGGVYDSYSGCSFDSGGSSPPVSSCSSSLDASACASAGGSYHYSFCTNPPCPEWCACP